MRFTCQPEKYLTNILNSFQKQLNRSQNIKFSKTHQKLIKLKNSGNFRFVYFVKMSKNFKIFAKNLRKIPKFSKILKTLKKFNQKILKNDKKNSEKCLKKGLKCALVPVEPTVTLNRSFTLISVKLMLFTISCSV